MRQNEADTARPAQAGTLHLIFRVQAQRFAVDARAVVEVLPRRRLKPLAHAPVWVAGLLGHRGQVIPVLDVSALLSGTPAEPRTSTRLVLVHYRPSEGATHVLGLILEQATDTLRCLDEAFQPYGLETPEAHYLGPVLQDPQGLVQRVRIDDLLTDAVRIRLFPDDTQRVPA